MSRLSWSTAVTLIDFVLSVAHSGLVEQRKQTFERIAQEIDLPRPLNGMCHDGLIIAAWILADWPARAEWLSDVLTSRPLEEKLADGKHLDAVLHQDLLELVRRSR